MMAPELSVYSEEDLLGMVATILAEEGNEPSGLALTCLETINREFILRAAKESTPERGFEC
jgi:hypothetical protein